MFLFKNILIFPYGINLKRDGKIGLIPVAPVKIFSDDKSLFLNIILLVDSGAEVTLLTSEDARLLNINKEEGKKIIISGISKNSITGYAHNLPIVLGEKEIKAPVIFSNSKDTPRVLGRQKIFEQFYVIFDEKNHRIIFVPREENFI